MSSNIQRILSEITRHGRVGQIAGLHDAARLDVGRFPATVHSSNEFFDVIGNFLNHQTKNTGGHTYPAFEARAKAKEMLAQHGRRHGRTVNNYIRDAIDGRNGGLRAVLDILTDENREQQTTRYVEDAIDRAVDPTDFDQKVAVTRQILEHYRRLSPGLIDDPRPEVHAHDCQQMLQEIGRHVDAVTDHFRRH